MHGGTVGVVYGAACLWQWKITPDEPGWPEWTNAPMSWREALDLEGSGYVAFISRAFRGFDYADMERRWDLTGGEICIKDIPANLSYHWFDPKRGIFAQGGKTETDGHFVALDANPWVLLTGERIFE